MGTTTEWGYWPQFKRYTITRTRTSPIGEDEVVQLVLTVAQVRALARDVTRRTREGGFK